MKIKFEQLKPRNPDIAIHGEYSNYGKYRFDVFRSYSIYRESADMSFFGNRYTLDDGMPENSNSVPFDHPNLNPKVAQRFKPNPDGTLQTTGICVGITSTWIIDFCNNVSNARSIQPGVFTHYFQDTIRLDGASFHYNYVNRDQITKHREKNGGSIFDMILPGRNCQHNIKKISQGRTQGPDLNHADLPRVATWACALVTGDHAIGIAKSQEGKYYVMDPHYGLFFYEEECDFLKDLSRLRHALREDESLERLKNAPLMRKEIAIIKRQLEKSRDTYTPEQKSEREKRLKTVQDYLIQAEWVGDPRSRLVFFTPISQYPIPIDPILDSIKPKKPLISRWGCLPCKPRKPDWKN